MTFLWLECKPGLSTCRGLARKPANSGSETKLHNLSVLDAFKNFFQTLYVVGHLIAYWDTYKDSEVLISILYMQSSKKVKSLLQPHIPNSFCKRGE